MELHYILLHLLQLTLIARLVVSKELQFSVDEETSHNHHVGILSVDNVDSMKVNFIKLESPKDASSLFSVDRSTGEIKVQQRIDREAICATSVNPYLNKYNSKTINSECVVKFEVNVLLQENNNLHDAITVHVKIVDINDNPCYFEPAKQVVRVPEDAKPGEYRFQINIPKDPDSKELGFGVETNSIILDENDYFILEPIKPDDHRMNFILKNSLDYERIHEVDLKINVNSFNEKSCSLNLKVLVLDVNDHRPEFKQRKYDLEKSEDTPVNSVLLTVAANDADSGENKDIIYEFDHVMSNPDYKNYLTLDQYNGSVILRKKFNFNDMRELKFYIVAKNPTSPKTSISDSSLSTVEVLIRVTDINDHAPEIRVLSIVDNTEELSVEEELANGVQKDIALVTVTDEDSGINQKVDCVLIDKTNENYLSLVKMNDKTYKIFIDKTIDREVYPEIGYEIDCKDRGKPSLEKKFIGYIKIRDVNDNEPRFDKDEFVLNVVEDSSMERQRVDHEIFRFHATDRDIGQNGQIEYSIVEGVSDTLSFFTIDKKTGKLSSQGNLDRESIDKFHLKIMARDNIDGSSLSTTTDVIINVFDYNDNKPKFDQNNYIFRVPEQSPVMTLIGSIFIDDADFGENGRINVDFSHEKMTLKIVREDTNIENSFMKELPLYPSSWFQLKINKISPNSIRLDILLTEMIDREYFYNLIKDQTDSLVDSINTQPIIEFSLLAKDAGSPSQDTLSTVQIIISDINDNGPVWIHPLDQAMDVPIFNVSINESPGYPFLSLKTEDLDAMENGTVKYKIIDGNHQSFFELNELSGQISIAPSNGYSTLAKIIYPLEIRAIDSSHVNQNYADIRIHIRVDDSKAKSPYSAVNDMWQTTNSSRRINFLIIVAIVVASFIVSTVLLTSIFIVLRKARIDHAGRQNMGQKPKSLFDPSKNLPGTIRRTDDSSLLYFAGNGNIYTQDTADFGCHEQQFYSHGNTGFVCPQDGNSLMNAPTTYNYLEGPIEANQFSTLYRKPDMTYSTGSMTSPNSSLIWSKNIQRMNPLQKIEKLNEDQDSGHGDSLEIMTLNSNPAQYITQGNLKISPTSDQASIYIHGQQFSNSILELNHDSSQVLQFLSDTSRHHPGSISGQDQVTDKGTTLTSSFV